MTAETKLCQSCQRSIRGRSDKKFCNDYCRNTHHNGVNGRHNNYIRQVNHCLGRNRRVLESLLSPTKQVTRISKEWLLGKGFSFHYFTHYHKNKRGTIYQFCYEYGYRIQGDAWV